MKVRHWVGFFKSGMHRVAEDLAKAERALGHDSGLVNCQKESEWQEPYDADVHVVHTHFPEVMRTRVKNRTGNDPLTVFIAHGTPEHVVEKTIGSFEQPGYGPADGYMMLREWLRTADAFVTFWPRHAAIYRSMVPKGRTIDCVPLGVDTAFWAKGEDRGHYAGNPAVWTSENQHRIKWVLDLLVCWRWVTEQVPRARLHAHYIPNDMHRFFVDLANTNGAAYHSFLSAATWQHEDLRNIWKSVDFLLSPVRYGDFNHLCLQAAANGLPVISYYGNPYATYWINEGDQRRMAEELVAIFQGEAKARVPDAVPDVSDTAKAMLNVYGRLLLEAGRLPDTLLTGASA